MRKMGWKKALLGLLCSVCWQTNSVMTLTTMEQVQPIASLSRAM